MDYKNLIRYMIKKINKKDKSYIVVKDKKNIYEILKKSNKKVARKAAAFLTKEKIPLLYKEGLGSLFSYSKKDKDLLLDDYLGTLVVTAFWLYK